MVILGRQGMLGFRPQIFLGAADLLCLAAWFLLVLRGSATGAFVWAFVSSNALLVSWSPGNVLGRGQSSCGDSLSSLAHLS